MSTVRMTLNEHFRVEGTAQFGRGEFITDADPIWGGLGEYPSPTDYVSAALGSCILTLMAMKAKSMHIDLTGTEIAVEKILNPQGRFDKFIITIDCIIAIDEKTATKLERSARGCPVHAGLHPDIEQQMIFKWNIQ